LTAVPDFISKLATPCGLVLFSLSSLLFPGQETFRRSIRRSAWRSLTQCWGARTTSSN